MSQAGHLLLLTDVAMGQWVERMWQHNAIILTDCNIINAAAVSRNALRIVDA